MSPALFENKLILTSYQKFWKISGNNKKLKHKIKGGKTIEYSLPFLLSVDLRDYPLMIGIYPLRCPS
jgi:hypothetical protein